MSSEGGDKSPYYSKRVRISDVLSPKDLVGLKEFTVEITYGNQEKIIIKNKNDVAEILNEKNIFDEVEELYKLRDSWAKQRGFKFVDQIIKRDSDLDLISEK
jgi:hypothetical protein